MKDFLGNILEHDDIVAFIPPFSDKLRKGYVVREEADREIKVKFWAETQWDACHVCRANIVKLNLGKFRRLTN